MARNTASCVRGLTETGWSSVIQPRLSVPRAAPEAPGWFSICANAARSARRDRIRVAPSRPSGNADEQARDPVFQQQANHEADGHNAQEHQQHQPRDHGVMAAGHVEDFADLLEPAGLLDLCFFWLAREEATLRGAFGRRCSVTGIRGFRHSASILRDLWLRAGRRILSGAGPQGTTELRVRNVRRAGSWLPGGCCRRTRCGRVRRGFPSPSCASRWPRAGRHGRRTGPAART